MICEFELPDVSLRCFVVRQLLWCIYALSSVNFQASNCGCVKKVTNMKYAPERDILRSCPESSPTPMSPCTRGIPLPAPLVFTPVPQKKPSCLNCDAEMAPGHQCDATDSESDWLKCHVCECLGRETSLVLRGSRCPSCGITAGLPSCLLCNCEPCNCQ